MKQLNKQILEAIQKGINLAVDDFDDEPLEVQKKARIKDDVHAKDFLNFVDLRLPSGTLWYKYNVGVYPEQLETAEDWYGNYYTFEDANSLKDYMPTSEQIQELIDETKSKWVENYNGINGLNGRTFTSKNGKSIFIPAAGFHSGSSLDGAGVFCYCWSSSLYLPDPQLGYYLRFSSTNIFLNANGQHYGFSARPVLIK